MDFGTIISFWGKSGGDPEKPSYHPVAYHLLDVAAVAEAVLEGEGWRVSRLAKGLHVAPDTLKRAIIMLLALHDIGKFSRAFQAKRPDLWPACLGSLDPLPPDRPHDDLGFLFLVRDGDDGGVADLLDPLFPGWMPSARNRLLAAIAGHHGQPARCGPEEPLDLRNPAGPVGPAASAAARAMTSRLLALFGAASLPQFDDVDVAALSFTLAGLTILADWVGSNRLWFGTVRAGPDLEPYLCETARPQAQAAMAGAGLSQSRYAPFAGIKTLFPEIAASASPVQRLAESVALPKGPTLILIEDATGSGKTEAALVLAHRLMAKQEVQGLYFALPTMATANSMFNRLAISYRRLFASVATPSLVLAHGRRGMHEGFRSSILPAPPGPIVGQVQYPADVPAEAFCAGWIADDRRKAFLADVGAGTIDQAILAVLPSRHQSLRLWGLAARVLIVDEAHAYDPYMEKELETLLTFQAALGGSAVVLSATLPQAKRTRLVDAFRHGLARFSYVPLKDERPTSDAYPLVTVVGSDGQRLIATGLRAGLARRVKIERLDNLPAAFDAVRSAAAEGAAVLWIRNTVDDAITAAREFRELGLDASLFHARFIMGDRLDREAAVISRFGRERNVRFPGGAVLIATQVVEQSLDLDFDLVLTDLAPVDLVIQRAGRLWRHMDRRPAHSRPVSGPGLFVLGPAPDDNASADWIQGTLPGTAAVYRDPKLLWSSMRALVDAGAIVTSECLPGVQPEKGTVRWLIESVYGDTPWAVPTALREASIKAEGDRAAARSHAGHSVLSIWDGYGGENQPWDDDTRVLTRLGDDTCTLRLGLIESGEIVPFYHRGNIGQSRAWALSEITVRRARVSGTPEPLGTVAALVEHAKMSWSRYDREMPLLIMEQTNSTAWSGRAMRGDVDLDVFYNDVLGLTFEDPHGRQG